MRSPAFSVSAAFKTESRYVSAWTKSPFGSIPSRSARSLICPADSSPDAYRTVPATFETAAAVCRTSVDLPIPGSPLRRISAPGTIPPPRTVSSSPMPVVRRVTVSSLISPNGAGFVSFCRTDDAAAAGTAAFSVSSANVFHSPQCGQRPNHRVETLPHSLQTKRVLTFAIVSPYIVSKSSFFLSLLSTWTVLPSVSRPSKSNSAIGSSTSF